MSNNENKNEDKLSEWSLLQQIINTPSKWLPDKKIEENNIQDTDNTIKKNNEAPKLKKEPLKLQDFINIFWAILIVSIIFFSSFLTYIVFNPDQAQFFIELWINPEDIKNLLKNLVNLSFWFVTIAISVIWIVLLFKAILTKSEYKKKKTIAIILSIFTWIILFSWITLWAFLINQIWATNYMNPYWWVILHDNNKLLSSKFKNNSIIRNTELNALIWPLTIRFDFTADTDYVGKYVNITWYEIDFDWDWKADKKWNINPRKDNNILYTYNKKWNISPKWKYFWIDKVTWKEIERPMKFANLNIIWIVKITEMPQRMWWIKAIFDATDISKLWKISWYLEEDLSKADFEWYKYAPNKIFNEEDSLVCMNIYVWSEVSNNFSKIFIISKKVEKNIQASIIINQDPLNPLHYTFSVSDIQDQNVWIASYKWIVNDLNIISREATADYKFLTYTKHNISVVLTDVLWNTTELKQSFNIRRSLVLAKIASNNPSVSTNNSLLRATDESWKSIIDGKYNKELVIYYIKMWLPEEVEFNANFVKVTDVAYDLIKVEWDFDWDWQFEKTWKTIKYSFLEERKYTIKVRYYFESKLKNDIQTIDENIVIEWLKKDIDPKLTFVQSSDYIPSIVYFDWSASQVREWKIVKFIYNFWEWKWDLQWDAKQKYQYNFPWEYKVTLTVVKEDWTKASTEQLIIVKEPWKQIVINSSISSWLVWKTIDFDAIWSVWQIDSYFWEFWDNNTSTEMNPVHIYQKEWQYKVNLTITFSDGTIKTWTKDIVIHKWTEEDQE